MDTAQKRAEYRRLREKGLAIIDKAIAENRPLTEAEQTQIEEAARECKAIAAELQSDRLHVPPEMIKQIDEWLASPEAARLEAGDYRVDERGRVIGQTKVGETLALKDKRDPHPWAVAITRACQAHGVKAFGMPSGSIPLPALSTVPVSMGQLGAPLVQAIGLRPWPAEGGRAVTYLRQTARINRAAIWRRGTAPDGSDSPTKPVTDLTSAAVVANAETIAHLASPIRREDLADFAGLDQWVTSELTYGITQALEAAVLTAAGPEPAMHGLLTLPGTTAVAAATDAPSTIEKAAVALANLGYGTGLQAALNPTDWSAIATAKGTDGHYLYPSLPTGSAAPSLFGVGIIATPNVPAGIAVVAAFRTAVQLYEREAVTASWGTTAAAAFDKNLIAALAEGRYALTVPEPAAVAIADLTP